jgi:GT2 family glycosyltransferase
VLQLSVVIPVYDNWWLTARCLRHLDALRGTGTVFETIVVDNASSDETPAGIANFPWVRYLRYEENRNFAGACNGGARLAQAPVTLFLNNDAYPLGDALTPLIEAFGRDDVAIAGGALFFEDGVTQAAGLVLLPNAHWHYYCRNLPSTLEQVDRSRDALAVSGAAMAVRTQWFVDAGGFDESFVNGFEDVDLCLRAREQQRAIAYVAQARFAHYEGASAGRFKREAENEGRFYRHWSAHLAALPRTGRGEVGAIAIESAANTNALSKMQLADLQTALRAFGHPLVRGSLPRWPRLDRRFRHGATLAWFSEAAVPGIAVAAGNRSLASITTHGAVALEVAWLPCAALERAETLGARRSDDPSCNVVGVAGGEGAFAAELARAGYSTVRITPETLLANRATPFACVVHCGLTDAGAYGNVLLAQAGIPAIALDTLQLRAIFADDVALICTPAALADAISSLVADPAKRLRYGQVVAADARRRFSPRRSAIRIVDLLAAARFGLERPAPARRNTPL